MCTYLRYFSINVSGFQRMQSWRLKLILLNSHSANYRIKLNLELLHITLVNFSLIFKRTALIKHIFEFVLLQAFDQKIVDSEIWPHFFFPFFASYFFLALSARDFLILSYFCCCLMRFRSSFSCFCSSLNSAFIWFLISLTSVFDICDILIFWSISCCFTLTWSQRAPPMIFKIFSAFSLTCSYFLASIFNAKSSPKSIKIS